MTEETETGPATDSGTAESMALPDDADKKKEKLHQTVEISEVGPCRKHVKVTIERSDLDARMDEKVAEMIGEAQVPGFRPGKAPRGVVVRRFHKDISDQVKGEVLYASLEQLAEENDIAPLAPPNLNLAAIEIPKEGPFIYEFDVEVRPEFDLPEYKGLKIKRPVKQFTDNEVAEEERRILSRYGQVVPKPDGVAEFGDIIVADMTTKYKDQVIGEGKEVRMRLDDTLAFKDGVAKNFATQVKGSKAGDTCVIDVVMSDTAANPALRGQTVQAHLDIKDVKMIRLPELTHEFLHEFGVHTPEQLREKVRALLEARLEYSRRQSAREQILQHITAAATWQLPTDLLQRQTRKAFARRVMEMRQAGMSDEEISARQRLLHQDTLQTTELALKEQFILQKIAEVEKLDVSEEEIDDVIAAIAAQTDQSPRRVWAQIEKEELTESLAAQVLERKALELILRNAEFEDVPLEPEAKVATVEEQAIPGEMHDPTATGAEVQPTDEQAAASGPDE
jgi:trigger factor